MDQRNALMNRGWSDGHSFKHQGVKIWNSIPDMFFSIPLIKLKTNTNNISSVNIHLMLSFNLF